MASTGKGGSRKRNPTQRENDLQEVARLYLQGFTQMQITEAINKKNEGVYSLCQQQIGYDVKTLHKRWIEAQIYDFNEAKAKELTKIDQLEATYWQAWEESKKPVTIEEVEKVDDKTTSSKSVTQPTYSRQKAKRKTETTYGDVRILEGIQWCINKRCTILGFNAPEKYQIDWRKEAEKEGVNASDVFNKMVEEFVGASPLDGEDGGGSLGGSTEAQE